jgi:hypothetical protein
MYIYISEIYLVSVQTWPALIQIVWQFTLNEPQEHAFRILAYHTLDQRNEVGKQLQMGVFGERETGKSTLIAAMRAWFGVLRRREKLIVTAGRK